MAANIADKFTQATNGSRPAATTLTALHSGGGTTLSCSALTGWPTATAVHFIVYTTDASGNKVAGSQTDWKGVVSGTNLINCELKAGTDSGYSIGAIVECAPTAYWAKDMADGMIAEHEQDGTHGAITPTSVVSSGPITGTVGTFSSVVVSGTATTQGWTPLGDVPDTITANGNRNYDIVFNGVDHTSTLSPGMKMQLTRTVAAPDQCADLEASSSQYFSRTGASVAGMTFTNNFTLSAWVKIESYGSLMVVHRTDGNSGFQMYIANTGQVAVDCLNGSPANYFAWKSYASIPLNKWVHIAAQIDMTVTTNLPTTNYVMIDGVDVAGFAVRGGTNPTALAQAGDLRIGAAHGGSNYFDGKIAQVAIYSAKVTQANILLTMSQGLSGSESTLVSAYSFDNSINDLNANANNLTANGGAAATDTDSPFANAVAAGLLEYAEVNSVSFSTNTTVNVRVPDTCQIPTSGGVSAVSYSTQSNPYGLPYFSNILSEVISYTTKSTTSTSAVLYEGMTATVTIPTGRKVRITLVGREFVLVTGGAASYADIWDGTVGSGTLLSQVVLENGGTGTIGSPTYISTIQTPVSATKTYNIGLSTSNAARSAALNATAGSPNVLTVELV